MTRPDDMLAHIINAMLDRNPNLSPEVVEDVIMGCGNPEGAMGHNIGRNAACSLKFTLTVGGTTVNQILLFWTSIHINGCKSDHGWLL